MYWRVKNLTPEHLARQYGVHAALMVSLFFNVILFVTRPNPQKQVTKEQKVGFEQFVRGVTAHLLDSSFITYEQSTSALLNGELAPSVVTQMRQGGQLPKSMEEMQATIATLTEQKQVSAVKIDSIKQGEPDARGLVPIEVEGDTVVRSAQESGSGDPVHFHFKFLVGENIKTKLPIVASISE